MRLVLSCADLREGKNGLVCKARAKGNQDITLGNCAVCDRPSVELVPLSEIVA